MPYLKQLQKKFSQCKGAFCGYGVATKTFQDPAIFWEEKDTYIQKEGILRDLRVFPDPDAFFKAHSQDLNLVKQHVFDHHIRHWMNRNIQMIRKE